MSEEEEQDLEDTAAAFQSEEAETNMQILTAIGFKRYDDDDGTNFGIRILNTKIGVKFNPENPTGKVWAYILTEDNKKDFIKNGDLNQLSLIRRYFNIQAGKKPIPEATVTGRIIERRGKGILVAIKEDGEKKEIFFGQGVVKKHDDGSHFIPLGFSKPSKDNPDGKMYVPRNILLPGMDAQPTTANREERGRTPTPAAEAAPAQPPAAKPAVKENLSVPGLIAKYTEMLALVTEAINAEDRIPEREKGYGIKFVFYSVKDALENGNKGDDREEA